MSRRATRLLDRARGAEQLCLERVCDADAELRAITEITGDFVRQMMQVHDQLADALPAQQLDVMLEQRLAADGHHDLRNIEPERTQSRTEAGGEDEGFHAHSVAEA